MGGYTHDFLPTRPPLLIVDSCFNVLDPLVEQSACELETGKCHGRGSLFDWRVGAIQVLGDAVCGGRDLRLRGETVSTSQFDESFLRVARAEVEPGGFEHEAFEADDAAGRGFEDLSRRTTGQYAVDDRCMKRSEPSGKRTHRIVRGDVFER